MNNRENYHDRTNENRKGEFSFETPFEFKRAIMLDMREDPVIASDGHIYERAAMERWLAEGRRISPMPGARLAHRFSAYNGHLDSVQQLLQNGATLTEKNKKGSTALLVAAYNGDLTTVQWLLQNGATLAEKDRHGDTALLLAASNGHLETVQWLLQHGACLNEKNKNGNTALFLAVLKGHLATVQWLLSEGRENIHDKNKAGKTVFDLAKKDEIKNFLKGFRMSEVHGRLFPPAYISGGEGEQAIFREHAAHHKDEQTDDGPLLVVGQKRKRPLSEPIHPMPDNGVPNEEKEREGKQDNSKEEANPIERKIMKEDKFKYIFIDEKNKDVYREQVLKWICDDFFSKEESNKHFYHDLDEIGSFFNKGQAMVVLNKSSGKELIGYIVWKKEDGKGDRTEITFVEVIEKYRGQGVFKKMLDELRIKLPNVTELSAKVIPQSIQIFKQTGFEVVTSFGNLFYCVKNIRNNIQLRKRERDEEESDNYDSPNVKNPSDGADLNFFIRQRSNDSLSPSSRGLFSSNSSGSSSIPTERVSARLN